MRRVATPGGAELVFVGGVVVKIHHRRTDPAQLPRRVALSAQPGCAAYLVAPVTTSVTRTPGGRLVTSWPLVEVLTPEQDEPTVAAVWLTAARLLAALHTGRQGLAAAATATLPEHGGPARLERVIARLDRLTGPGAPQAPAVRVVAAAAHRVAAQLRASPIVHCGNDATLALVHGDWHLGQLGRQPGAVPGDPYHGWRLLDIDDLGVGHPAWDLGRPAGFWAAGLLEDSVWTSFLDAYRAAGGPALPSTDPWPVLDLPARAAVIVAAARQLARGANPNRDEEVAALVTACSRMRQ